MRVMGIDPGTLCTGYGVVDSLNGTLSLVACGAITNQSGNPLSERFHKIYQVLTDVISEFHPECVSIESIFFCKNVNSAIKLGMVRGIAILASKENGVPVVEYSPRRVKQAVVGYGNAHKSQVMVMIKRLLNLEQDLKKEDISDAIANAICHLNSIKNKLSEPVYI